MLIQIQKILASRDGSPVRTLNGNGHANGISSRQVNGNSHIQANGHSSDQHSDDEYIDTVEVIFIQLNQLVLIIVSPL